jgi:outer membrane autotransporter protein
MKQKTFNKTAVCSLVAAMALGSASHVAQAGNLDGPGASADVGAGSPVEAWSLTNGARLNITAGGVTNAIQVQGSTLNMAGGTSAAISLANGANSTIAGSRIESTTGRAFSIGSIGGDLRGSSAVITDSTISGRRYGASILNGESSLVLSGTTLVGLDDGTTGKLGGGIGLGHFGGSVLLNRSSTVTGDRYGISLAEDSGGGLPSGSKLVVDGSRVEGKTGSAIFVSRFTPSLPMHADIIVSNGSSLIGGNGVLLDVRDQASASFNVDNSALTGNVVVDAASTATVALRSNASLTGDLTGIASLSVDGSTLKGNVNGKADGSTSVLLSSNSVLEGQLNNIGSLDVDSGAAWRMTGNGSVANLSMNGGSVAISDGSGSKFNTLTVANLSGNGSFSRGANLAALQGDLLVVTNNASGTHQLNIRNTGANPQNLGALKVVDTAGGDATFSVVGGAVDAGTYKYSLDRQGEDWFLVGTSQITASAATVIGLHSTAPTVWYGEAASLRSRLGDLRLGNVEAGAWARTYSRGYRVGSGAGQAYDQKQTGVSVGMDRRVPVANGQLLVGGFGGYSKSDLDFDLGASGKVDSYYLGAYATWLRDDGYYVDGLIKFNRFKNTAAAVMSDGAHAGGEYRSHGWGGQIEAGRHMALADSNWFVEPYVQLSAVRAGGKDYWLNNGMHAENADMNSVLGRVGTSVGLNYKTASGGIVRPYVKFALAHEFAKSNKVFVNGDRFNNDLSGTRVEVGLGIAARLTQALQLHADLDYASGKNFKQKWGANLGLRYAF